MATLTDLIGADGVFTDGDWVETKDQDPDGGIRLTQLADVGEGLWRDRSERYMTLAAAQRLGCTFLEPDDVLVARMPDPLGRACLFPGDSRRCVTAVDVCIVRPGTSGVDARWLMWWLNTPRIREEVLGLQAGTTRKRISRKNLGTIPLPIPPRSEQRRIADAIEEQLSRLDAAMGTFGVLRLRLDALERSVLMHALADGEERRLGDLLEGIEAGRSFGGAGGPAGPDEWGVIRVSAMTWGDFKPDENKMVPAEDANPRWEIRQGDLLLSRANTTDYVGAAVLVAETRPRLLLSDKSLRLLVKPDVDKSWLLCALSAPQSRRQISAVATGTSDSMRNISQEKLRAITLRVPRSDRQAAIAQRIESELQRIVDLRKALNAAERRASGLRRSILASAFRGQLVPQDPDDEPASVLLERIASERAAAPKPPRRSRERAPA
ncbi:MAG: restriction endonuclease subunit S domain-containing protein [Gaiellaceae bacterium]